MCFYFCHIRRWDIVERNISLSYPYSTTFFVQCLNLSKWYRLYLQLCLFILLSPVHTTLHSVLSLVQFAIIYLLHSASVKLAVNISTRRVCRELGLLGNGPNQWGLIVDIYWSSRTRDRVYSLVSFFMTYYWPARTLRHKRRNQLNCSIPFFTASK